MRNLDGFPSAFIEPVRPLCIGPRVAEEAIDGGLAGAEINVVDGVRDGEHAANLAVGGRSGDVGGEIGSGREGRRVVGV